MKPTLTFIVLLLMLGGCVNEQKVKEYLIGKWIFIDDESNYYELWLNDQNLSIGYIGVFDVLNFYEYEIEGRTIHFYKIYDDTAKHLSFSYKLNIVDENKFIGKANNIEEICERLSSINPEIFDSYEKNLVHLDSLRFRTREYYYQLGSD